MENKLKLYKDSQDNCFINDNGIWFNKEYEEQPELSYQEDGHDLYLQIEESSFWFNYRNQCINKAIQNFHSGNIFYDVGGGNGYVSRFLENNGHNTILVEPSIHGCKNAKNRGLKNIYCMPFEDVQIQTTEPISAGLFDVIEHIEDHHSFLKSIKNKIPKGSKIFITVPAYKTLWSHEDIIAGHYRRYTKNSLENVIKDVGLKTVYSTYFFSFLPLPIFLFRSIPFLMKIKSETIQNKEDVKANHKSGSSLSNQIISSLLKIESKAIENKMSIPFGGSILLVAEK